MLLPTQTFSGLVEQMAAGLQGSASYLLDLTVGSVLRAILEAAASVALWLQWLILQVLSMTRATTSSGPALDSWMADFSLIRLPATAASGVVTFSRLTDGMTITIPVGTLVRATTGLQTFSVSTDTGNQAWDGSDGYNLGANANSVDVPVVASTAGANGNVQPGAIGVISSPIAGIDAVTNLLPTSGGLDAEADAAFRARFQLYINSRSLATTGAILSALANLRQGLRFDVLENQTSAGITQAGHFCVIVDDGTGYPSADLLASAYAAVDAVRPLGSTFSVNGPSVTLAAANIVLQTTNRLTHAAIALLVEQNILSWIKGLPIGGTLALSKLEAIAHGADPTVTSVTSALINGVAGDLVVGERSVIVPSTIVVS